MSDLLLQLREVKKSTWVLSLVTLLTLLFSLYRWTGGGESHIFTAETLFSEWRAEPHSEAKFSALEKTLKKQDSLHSKFASKIGQRLLCIGQAGLSESYLSSVLKRNEGINPDFSSFAKISLLIGKKEYLAALEESKILETKLSDQAFPYLTLCNLVRIATLEAKLGSFQNSLVAWEKLKLHEKFNELAQIIHTEGLTLRDFIEFQKDIKK